MNRAPLPIRRTQHGASLVFAMITVVALSLAAVALIRSVDTGVNILGNLGFKQDTLMAADRATQKAVEWMQGQVSASASALDASQPDLGYVAAMVDGLDPVSSSKSATRAAIDWNRDGCSSQPGPTPRTCVPALKDAIDLGNGIRARYLIVRLCSDIGSSTSGTVLCPRPPGSNSTISGERNQLDTKNSGRIGTTVVTEYYRVIVRAEGARNTVSLTETLVHF